MINWKDFLKTISKNLLERLNDDMLATLPREAIDNQWLGFAEASDDDIVDVERRLGMQIPPSYKAFLKASNGWYYLDDFISKLWPTQEVMLFSTKNQEIVDIWTAQDDKVPDANYFVYGQSQDPIHIRTEYLKTIFEIGYGQDNVFILLNPMIVTDEGEWETWFFASWLPGAVRYQSFYEFVKARHIEFVNSSPKLRDLP
jgi:hypothetical protein